MPDHRMTLCNRLIGGVVDGLMIAIDTITSFWQTPREVEWAKAAADGLAEREAEDEVAEPHAPQYVGYVDSDGVTRVERAGVKYDDAMERHHRAVRGLHEAITALVPETSATTPGAVDGPAEGSPDKPSAGVGLGKVDECLADLARLHLAPSAEVEPPASAPSAESPAPEFDWVTTAIPVIAGVLGEHVPSPQCNYILCLNGQLETCGEFRDWQGWRDHVAPHIAIAIQNDLLATIYEDTTFAINAFSGDRPRPLADFPKHQNPRM